MEVHTKVEEISEYFWQALSRRVYITPKSYLDLMSLFTKLLYEKREELLENRSRYQRGVERLKKTNEDVANMQIELTDLQPILEKKKTEADELSKIVEADTIEANKVKEVVEEETKVVEDQAA